MSRDRSADLRPSAPFHRQLVDRVRRRGRASAFAGVVIALLAVSGLTQAFAAGPDEPGASVFAVPPPSGAVQGFSGTSSAKDLVAAQRFDVLTVSMFDQFSQTFRVYIPGAPAHVNQGFEQVLTPHSIVWIRRADRGEDAQNVAFSARVRSYAPLVPLSVPIEGGVTQGTAGVSSTEDLVRSLPFEVESVGMFDFRSQRFLFYVPGAPPQVNSLTDAALSPRSIVWVRRARGRFAPPVATPPPAPASGLVAGPTPTPTLTATPSPTSQPAAAAGAPPAAGGSGAPASTSTSTPSPTQAASPAATQTSTPTQTSTATPRPTQTPTQTQSSTPTQTSTPAATQTSTPAPTPTRTASPTPTASPSPTPTSTPSGSGYFATLGPGSTLPSGATCAARVRSVPENMQVNATANSTTGVGATVQIDGASSSFNSRYASRIDGNFTGTTDEILQWAACKWGFDEDVTRARAWAESSWRQSFIGDNGQSFGILQVKRTVHEGTHPRSQQSTAFNADYSLAWLRSCYEGDFGWMSNYEATGYDYAAGDLWGCVGAWFSGTWYDGGAQSYIGRVQSALRGRPWE